MNLPKAEIDRRKAIEDRVAAAWGVWAPYPPPDVWGEFHDRVMIGQRVRQSAPEDRPRNWTRSKARPRPGSIDAETAKIHAKLIAKRDGMIAPAPYRSWEHIAAFSDREWVL
jgi:hypothetical protein